MADADKIKAAMPGQFRVVMQRAVRHLFANRRAWCWVVCVGVIVGSWRLAVAMQRPANLDKIIKEIGSVAEFWGEPVPNPAGTRILFQQSTETGVGTFFSDIPSGRRVLLREKHQKSFDTRDFMSSGWSPDGREFAFAHRLTASSSEVLICDGSTDTNCATVKVAGSVGRLVWLSDEAIVYVDEEQTLHKLEKIGGSRWRAPKAFLPEVEAKKGAKKKRLNKEDRSALLPVRRLTAATPNSVFYLRGQALWNWEFGVPAPVKVWESTTNEPVDITRDLNGPRFLLHCGGGRGTKIFQFDWPSKDFTPAMVKPAAQSAGVPVKWFAGGGNAWVRGRTLYVASNPAQNPTAVVFDGGVNSLVANDRELFLVGSRAGEPVAIWKYDVRKAELSCVVSNSQPAYKFAKAVYPSRETVTNRDGRVISYRLWSPPQSPPGKKRPLLAGRLDDERWFGYPGLVANGGAFFMSVDEDFEKSAWGAALLTALEHAKTNNDIDETSLFIYAYSGGTQFVRDPLENRSEMWRGVILFSPVVLPDLRRSSGIKLHLDRGADDRFTAHLPKYHDEMARLGIAVSLAVHENAGHHYMSIASLRERDEAMMKFLFGR